MQTEFTLEKHGTPVENDTTAGYYISTVSTITTLDRRLRVFVIQTLARDDVATRTISVVIPNDLTSGQNYWLGVIIDDDDSIEEVAEGNNATYIGLRVN